MSKTLVNRVANSSLRTIDLEAYYPDVDIDVFDLKDHLFQGLILREKDFRAALKTYAWDKHEGHVLLVYCSADAIIPLWAYMLVASHAEPHVQMTFQGQLHEFLTWHYLNVIRDMDAASYQDQRVVIKGCSEKTVPAAAYAAIAERLRPFAQSIMFGEPCSTVPIFKRPRKITSS